MRALRDTLNAFLATGPAAVAHARRGPLAGRGLAVKDIFDIAGLRTGGGNPQRLEEAAPAAATAPAIAALLDAGARFVGKTQTDELTFSLMGQNAHYPRPVNPAAPDRVTGGSSSGSAAAVAGGLAEIAAGSDTGGSIRAPASFCGLIGLRTTHGRIPLDGAMPLAPSFDTFGWFARDAALYEAVGEVLLGEDEPAPHLTRAFTLAALDALVLDEAEAAEYRRMQRAIATVIGTPVEEAPLSQAVDDLYMTFRRLQGYEAWAVHGPWISQKERGLGPGVKERFAFGRTIDCAAATAETARRAAFREELAGRLGRDGLLVLPTVPGAAPLSEAGFDTIQAYRERALRLLCLSGLSGFPQITLPLGLVENAPFGISLLGPAGSDMALIRLARKIMNRPPGV